MNTNAGLAGRGRTILIVEEPPEKVAAVVGQLVAQGFRVAVTHDEGEAAQRLRCRADDGPRSAIGTQAPDQAHFVHQLLEAIPSPVFFKDENGRYMGCNRAFEAFIGVARADLIGKSVYDISPKELADVYFAADRALFEAGGTQVYEASVKYADGTLHDVTFHKATFSKADGSLGGLVGVIHDITGRKRAELALRASEDRFRRLTQLSTDWLWEQDAELRFTRLEGEGGFAVPPAQSLGKRRWELGLEIASGGTWEEHRRLLEARQPFRDLELVRLDADGSLVAAVRTSGEPVFGAGGAFLGYRGVARDITERKKLEQALSRKDAELRMVMDAVPATIAYLDSQERYVYVNRAHALTYGYRGDAVGRTGRELLGEAAYEATRPYRERVLAGEPVSFERTHRGGDGLERVLAVNQVPHFDAAGRVVGFYSLTSDVTERKREDRLLRMEHGVVRCLAEVNDEIEAVREVMRVICETHAWDLGRYFEVDESAGVLRFRAAWCRPDPELERFVERSRQLTFGVGLGLCGLAWRSGAPVWSRDARNDPRTLYPVPGSDAGTRGAFVFPVSAEGKVLSTVAISGRELREPDARLLDAVRVIGSQVGQFLQRQRAERALRESEQRFRYVTLATRDAIYDWTIPHNRVWRNDAYQAMFAPDEPVGTDETWWEARLHPEDRSRILESIGAAFKLRAAVWSDEYRFQRHDGRYADVLDRGYILYDAAGAPLRLIGAITDITERKLAEAALARLNLELEQRIAERTAELAAANQELEAFSYSVSHDLRAPLRAIGGFSRLLEQECAGQIPAEGRRLLGRIVASVRQMAALIDGLLEFARLSRTAIVRERVAPAQLVRQVLDELAPAHAGREVEVALRELPECVADRILLKQVFANLLSNAYKYSARRDGAQVEVGARSAEGETVFYVRDNGAGFDMQYIDKLFGVFQRLHAPSEFEGIGVGLATVRRIIERHGGRIWAESAPGAGATFYFTLGG